MHALNMILFIFFYILLFYIISKFPDAVKGYKIGIVVIIGSSQTVIKSGAGDCNQVISVKLPVHILKSMVLDIRMIQIN